MTPLLVFRDGDGHVVARGGRRGRERLLIEPSGAEFRFPIPEGPQLPVIETRSPPGAHPRHARRVLRHVVRPLALAACGRAVLHASAVSGSGALVFCGRSGIGKSTLAAACGRRSWSLIADDAVLLEPDPEEPDGVSVFCPAARFDDPSADGARLGALFLLRRAAGAEPAARPLRGREGMTALFPHLHTFDPDNPDEHRRLAAAALEVVARCSPWELSVGQGKPGLTATVELLERRFTAVGS